jgi:hypothetical protein
LIGFGFLVLFLSTRKTTVGFSTGKGGKKEGSEPLSPLDVSKSSYS